MGFFIKIMHQLLKNMLHAIVEPVNFNKKKFVENYEHFTVFAF